VTSHHIVLAGHAPLEQPDEGSTYKVMDLAQLFQGMGSMPGMAGGMPSGMPGGMHGGPYPHGMPPHPGPQHPTTR
jgi:hypothetical protein